MSDQRNIFNCYVLFAGRLVILTSIAARDAAIILFVAAVDMISLGCSARQALRYGSVLFRLARRVSECLYAAFCRCLVEGHTGNHATAKLNGHFLASGADHNAG